MFSNRFAIMKAVVFAFLLATNAKAAPESKADINVSKLAEAAVPMKAAALEKIYAGKTWKWKTGAGYFSADEHRFVGLSRYGRDWYSGDGHWFATNGGKLCMRAGWHGKAGSSGSISCLLHREKNGVIYQKPSLGGKWYVFRHNPVQKHDEVHKLVRGDRVSKKIDRIKSAR